MRTPNLVNCAALLVAALGGVPAVCLGQGLHIRFDTGLEAEGVAPVLAEGVTLEPAREGRAARIGAGANLAYTAPEFLTEGFDIRLWVKHDRPLRDLHFEELVYLYHETPDEKNRICLKKRQGTDYILFSMSDDTGRAKGAQFAGDWFAMKSPPLDWEADAWRELRITADRARGEAALFIDGVQVAGAQGTEMPRQVGERLWLGSLMGRSHMLGLLDEVVILPAGGEAP